MKEKVDTSSVAGAWTVLLLVSLLTFSRPASAVDTDKQRGAALGAYLTSTAVISELITSYCPDVKFKTLKSGVMALEQEKPYISATEYREVERYLTSDVYKAGVKDIVQSYAASITAGVSEGMDPKTSCGLAVGIYIGTAKGQKDRWDSIKVASRPAK